MASARLVWLLALGVCGLAQAATYNGTVFEDVNYGGGPGRSRTASGGVGIGGVRVELYSVTSGALLDSDTTSGTGAFSLSSGGHAAVRVRVVNGTVRSTRTNGSGCTTCVPVQTFRTEGANNNTVSAVTNRVGGENPAFSDAVSNTSGLTFTQLTSNPGQRTPQSVTTIDATANGSTVNNIDFGFNFSTVVNTRDAASCGETSLSYPCQGSLRQFLINANVLGGKGSLAQSGSGQLDGGNAALPAGFESSIFMIPTSALTGNVAVITLASGFPAVSTANIRLDATTQTVNIGNTNLGTLGTGGSVGADAISLPALPAPEVQLNASDTVLTLSGNSTAILGFALRQGYILLSGSGCLARNNGVGMTATGNSGDNAAAAYGITFTGANSTVRNNFVTVNNSGIRTDNAGAGSVVTLNEVARPTSGHTNTFDGILLIGNVSNIQVTANLTRDQSGGGIEVGFGGGAVVTNVQVTNNTVRRNGFASVGGGAASSEPVGVAAYDYSGNNVVFSRNLIQENAGAGIMVMRATNTRITQNVFSSNGGLSIDLDPRSIDPNGLGSPEGVTLNDANDSDTGPNGLLNYPVIANAMLFNGQLSFAGFARPGSSMELYVAQADPSGFGEGLVYLGTFVEGSAADLDATTGSYGPGAINGVAQGSDNTNRFSFQVPAPGGVAIGTALSATATIGNQTSEFAGNVTVTGGPALQVSKVVVSESDPVNATDNPKSIPGAQKLYTISVENQGTGAVDSNSVVIVSRVPPNTRLYVGDLGAPGSGPIGFVDGSPSSALSWTFSGLASTTDDLEFSDDGGANWDYEPTPDAQGYDAAVTDIRMSPKGQMPGQGTGNPKFDLNFRVQVN